MSLVHDECRVLQLMRAHPENMTREVRVGEEDNGREYVCVLFRIIFPPLRSEMRRTYQYDGGADNDSRSQ